MRGLNKVTLIGHLGKTPEVQKLEGGVAVAKCSVATTEGYRDEEGNKKYVTEIIAESFILLDKVTDKPEINASFI